MTPEYGGTPTGTVTFYENGDFHRSASVERRESHADGYNVDARHLLVHGHLQRFDRTLPAAARRRLLSQVVNKAATTTAVVSSSPTVTHGTPVTFTATVTATAPSTAVPPGSVVFYDTFNGTRPRWEWAH